MPSPDPASDHPASDHPAANHPASGHPRSPGESARDDSNSYGQAVTDGRLSVDLTPAFCDAYIRRVLAGPGGEPLDLGLHRMRVLLDPDAPDHERVLGLRFREIAAVATQALRETADGAWVGDASDWVSELAFEGAMPPTITSFLVGSPDTVKRLLDAAENLHWLAGTPLDVGVFRRAPILVEITAEGTLLTGESSRLRLFVAAGRLEARNHHGPVSLVHVLEKAGQFIDAWERHHALRLRDPGHPEDLRFEWLAPPQAASEDDDERATS